MMDDDSEMLLKELSIIYRKIDKQSSLYWAHDSMFQKKLRSMDDQQNTEWRKNTNAQIGYGEVTKVLMLIREA
jgi:hypothetical protein